VGVAVVIVAVEYVRWYVAGLHYNQVTLNDPSAESVALATDLDAYRVLLDARPSPAWKRYYDQVITEKGLERVFKQDVQILPKLRADGRIVALPNGTHAVQVDRIRISAPGNPLHFYSVEAVKVRIGDASHKRLNAWTLPELVQHHIAWP